MNEYRPHRPRTAIALAAAALTAITIGLLVVAPAKFDATSPDGRTTLAIARKATPTEVAISPARIDVVGIRESGIAATPVERPEIALQLERPVVTPLAVR